MAQVVDASIAIAWCAPSQATARTKAALLAVVADGALVPSSFWYEVFHALSRLERRGIVSADEINAFVADISELDFSIDEAGGAREMFELYRVAQRTLLSIYDAGYLELALRSDLPLATNDRMLESAARNAGVTIFAP